MVRAKTKALYISCLFFFSFPIIELQAQHYQTPKHIQKWHQKLSSSKTRNASSKALLEQGKQAIPILLLGFISSQKDVPKISLNILKRMGKKAVWFLANRIAAPKQKYKALSIQALRKLAPSSSDFLILMSFKHRTSKSRKIALLSLIKMGRSALPALVKGLGSTNAKLRFICTKTIGQIGPSASQGVKSLRKMLYDRSPDIRKTAAWSLAKIGSQAHESIPDLIQKLHDSDREVIELALWSLGTFGSVADVAISQMSLLFAKKSPRLLQMLRWSILRIFPRKGAQKVIDSLSKSLLSPSQKERKQSILALTNLGATKVPVYIWKPVIKDAQEKHRAMLISVLQAYRKRGVPLLQVLLSDKSQKLQIATIKALGELKSDAQSALKALEQKQGKSSPLLKNYLVRAIKQIRFGKTKRQISFKVLKKPKRIRLQRYAFKKVSKKSLRFSPPLQQITIEQKLPKLPPLPIRKLLIQQRTIQRLSYEILQPRRLGLLEDKRIPVLRMLRPKKKRDKSARRSLIQALSTQNSAKFMQTTSLFQKRRHLSGPYQNVSVKKIMQKLSSKRTRRQAKRSLQLFAVLLLPKLKKQLLLGNVSQKLTSLYLLRMLGSRAIFSLAPVRYLLGHRNLKIQVAAAKTIGEMGSSASPALLDLLWLKKEGKPHCAKVAQTAIKKLGISAILAQKKKLGIQMFEFKQVIQQTAKRGSNSQRRKAREILRKLKIQMRNSQNARKKWKRSTTQQRIALAQKLGSSAKSVLPALFDCIKRAKVELQLACIYAIGQIKPPLNQVQKKLFQILKSSNWKKRKAALYSLSRISFARSVRLQIKKKLKDPNWQVRQTALQAISYIGPLFLGSLKDIQKRATSSRKALQLAAQQATESLYFGGINPKPTEKLLRKLNSSRNLKVQIASATQLCTSRKFSSSEQKRLLKTLKSKNASYIIALLWCLEAPLKGQRNFYRALQRLLRNRNTQVRSTALWILGKHHPKKVALRYLLSSRNGSLDEKKAMLWSIRQFKRRDRIVKRKLRWMLRKERNQKIKQEIKKTLLIL